MTLSRGAQAREREPVWQRHGDLHRGTAAPRASSSSRSRSAWSGSTCPSRCRSRLLEPRSVAGRRLSSVTHIYGNGPEGIQFYTRGKVVTSAGPTRGPAASTSGSRDAVSPVEGPRRGILHLKLAGNRPDSGMDESDPTQRGLGDRVVARRGDVHAAGQPAEEGNPLEDSSRAARAVAVHGASGRNATTAADAASLISRSGAWRGRSSTRA